ncbi:hypothetical protein [Citrobacter amalonaticus]|nr:hypothetical protein [Citrobacter amalonaticus]
MNGIVEKTVNNIWNNFGHPVATFSSASSEKSALAHQTLKVRNSKFFPAH